MTGRTLVMTVGTGDIDRIEDTLLAPLRKSIATDAWDRLDYASAVSVEMTAPPSEDWSHLWPTDDARSWVPDFETP